jgi:hypothetical protein
MVLMRTASGLGALFSWTSSPASTILSSLKCSDMPAEARMSSSRDYARRSGSPVVSDSGLRLCNRKLCVLGQRQTLQARVQLVEIRPFHSRKLHCSQEDPVYNRRTARVAQDQGCLLHWSLCSLWSDASERFKFWFMAVQIYERQADVSRLLRGSP